MFKITNRNIVVILMYFVCLIQVGGRVQSRWDLIYTALRGGFKSSLDMRVRILIHCNPPKKHKTQEIQFLHNCSGLPIYTRSVYCKSVLFWKWPHGGGIFNKKKHIEFMSCFKSISNSPLQEAILTYNTAHAKKWDFTALNLLCTEVSCGRLDHFIVGC